MNLSLLHLAMILPPLLLIEALFSGSEIALLSSDRVLLKGLSKNGNKGAERALRLLHTPERIFSTTLLVTNLCMIGITALVTLFFLERTTLRAELYAVLVASPLIVLLGEFIPKALFQRYADRIAPHAALLINIAFFTFYPITRFLSLYTQRVSKLIGPVAELLGGKKRGTREEIQILLSDGKTQNDLQSIQKRMLKRIFEFKDSEAKHALIPLVKVEAIEENSSVREAIERFHNNRHSRMPVFQNRIDNIVGVLELADLYGTQNLDTPIKNFITPAQYVAETQSLDDLLLFMHKGEIELAIVVDEYGGAIGIVTFEDIVEEIVGEINDEYDSGTVPFKKLTPSKWLIQGKMEIQAFKEQIGLTLPEGDYETLAGFLLQQFGRIPETHDELYFMVEGKNIKFQIRQASDRRIESVLVEVIQN